MRIAGEDERFSPRRHPTTICRPTIMIDKSPGQDPHSAPDMNPLWVLLDTTPDGRGTDWYPALDD